MKDLLAKWAELEPAKCKPLDKSVYAVSIGRRWYLIHPNARLLRDRAYLQLAVQQAVEARGLNWSISFLVDKSEPGYGGSQHTASVFTYGKRYVREGLISAAEAILSAYLQAIAEPTTLP